MPPPAINTKLISGRSNGALIQRYELDTKTPGQAVVTRVLGSETISASHSGVDLGSGDVTLSLPKLPLNPGVYNTVRVDAYGRVVQAWNEDYSSGGGGGPVSGAINNQFVSAQNGSFWISGRARVDGDATFANVSISGSLSLVSLNLSSPLSIANGGTGSSSVNANFAFIGPVSGAQSAPSFRALVEADLPQISFNKIYQRPSTLGGYGIVDAWTKSEADSRYANAASFEPIIATGSALQYIKGNKSLGTLNTDSVVEATNLYFTQTRARNSVSISGTNLTYDPNTGAFGLVPAPSFTKVTVSAAPTANSDLANKGYVDSVSAINELEEDFDVTVPSNKTFQLANSPIHNSITVYLNGLQNREGPTKDYTVSGSSIIFTNNATLTAGDVVSVKYRY